MADPLLASLLAGNSNGLALDPTFAQAVPDIQLAQAMQQQALSSAPASPAQAASRLVQALSGTYIERQAANNIGRAMAGTSEDMARVLEQADPKNPLIAGLRSNNPVTRAESVATFPKVMTMLGSPSDLGRGTQRKTGVTENTNPLTEAGGLAQDQARATGRPLSPLAAAL